MASFLRPKRGQMSTAQRTLSGTGKLKSGEVFFEMPNGKTPGNGQGRLMMGNGTDNYSALKPFLAFDENAVQTFTDVTSSTDTDVSVILQQIRPTSTLANNLNKIKQALFNTDVKMESINHKVEIMWDQSVLRVTDMLHTNFTLGSGSYTMGSMTFSGYKSVNLSNVVGFPDFEDVLTVIIARCANTTSSHRCFVQLGNPWTVDVFGINGEECNLYFQAIYMSK